MRGPRPALMLFLAEDVDEEGDAVRTCAGSSSECSADTVAETTSFSPASSDGGKKLCDKELDILEKSP